MQVFQVFQGFLLLNVALITIPSTAGFKCSKCADIRSVQINNTNSGLVFTVGSLKLPPRSSLCETSTNGEDVTGVSIVDCPQKSLGGSRDNRCVHYNGALDISVKVNQGEVNVRYEGTFRDCLLEYISASSSCANQMYTLPEDSKLRAEALSTSPHDLTPYSVTVDFSGEKCVSDANGNFPSEGLKCAQCADIRNAQILKNTVPDFTLDIGSLILPSNRQCESAQGVSVVKCPQNSPSGSLVNRCVHYSGTLDLTIKVGTSGEVKVRYEGTYRDCLLENIFASGSCADQVTVLPYDSKLRAAAISTSPYDLSSYSVTVEFNGRKCVSDNQGIFLAVNKSPLIVAMTGCNMFVIVASYIISKVYS